MVKTWIRAVKEMEEMPHPNLRKEIFLNTQILETKRSKLGSLEEKDWRELIEKVFEKRGLKTYPDRYPFEEKEEVSVVVYRDEDAEEVFRGEVSIPEEYQGRDADSVDIYG